MEKQVDPRAGQLADRARLVDVSALVDAYCRLVPDPGVPAQRVTFGTSGHRGSSFSVSFNEAHILAITQAICQHRTLHGVDGPLFIGIDTHALSRPAFESAMEVLAANGVQVMIAAGGEYTPTPVISHAILTHNRGRTTGLADGIVVTPSHNPPDHGGIKYNSTNGGPADTGTTAWIETAANALLAARQLTTVRRTPIAQAMNAASTREHDYVGAYVQDLGAVIDVEAIRASGIRMGVDPLGGAGVHYWARIAEVHHLNLSVVSDTVDPTFSFMTVDWDGQIRMDPSSPYAMRRLVALKDRYDIAFACDTDHDRHGIVAPSCGLMPANHYLTTAVDYLFTHRPSWSPGAGVGKTVVSSALIDRVAARLGRVLLDMPVGFKWFVDGLFTGSLGFGGEESAGAAFLRRDGTPWSTDKDGIVAALLAAEMTARGGLDPGRRYRDIANALGEPFADRIDARATPAQKTALSRVKPDRIHQTSLAGDPIERILDRAPGNGAAIGGIKVVSTQGWFAARPSGTEDIYKIYGESFRSEEHLRRLLQEAQEIVDAMVKATN